MTTARLSRRHTPTFLGALALLGALLMLLAGCGSQAGAWRLIGPDDGAHVFAIAADPHVAGLVYAGADDGGVYRARADQQGYAVSGAGIPHDAVVASLLPDAQRAGVILAGTSDGLYRSDHYGDQWSAFGVGLPRDRAVVALATTPDGATLLAGVDHGGLYRGANAGATWVAANSGLPAQATPAALLWDAPAHLWLLGLVATSATPLYISADGGQTWTPSATGLPAGAQVNALTLLDGAGDPAQPSLFAATTDGLFTSADAGRSWSHVGGGLPEGSALALATLSQQPTWLYVSIGSGVYYSTDGGAQWQMVAPGLTAQAQGLAVTQDKKSGTVVFVAAGQVARYPTGVPASGFPTDLLLAALALALIVGGYIIMRRMRRFGYAMGALRNESNTGRAAAAAERWGDVRERSATGAAAEGGSAASAEPTSEGRVIAPTEQTPSATTTRTPADGKKAAQNGHSKPKKRRT